MQYRGSLVGRHLHSIAQLAIFLFGQHAEPILRDVWVSLSRLCAMLFTQTIQDIPVFVVCTFPVGSAPTMDTHLPIYRRTSELSLATSMMPLPCITPLGSCTNPSSTISLMPRTSLNDSAQWACMLRIASRSSTGFGDRAQSIAIITQRAETWPRTSHHSMPQSTSSQADISSGAGCICKAAQPFAAYSQSNQEFKNV